MSRPAPPAHGTVLDANPGPGGAWRHRWPSLTFGGAHGIADLPGLPLGTPDPTEPASAVIERYYGTYEERFGLPVVRPVRVTAVTSDDGPGCPLTVTTDVGRRAAFAARHRTA